MSDTQLYLGLDLDPEYTQLSYYNVDTREPESVYHKEARDTYMLPNIMFYSAYNKKSDDGQSEAYKFIDLAGWCAGRRLQPAGSRKMERLWIRCMSVP